MATGRNLNFTVVEEDEERVGQAEASFGENDDRLVRLKYRCDLIHFFLANANTIKPPD